MFPRPRLCECPCRQQMPASARRHWINAPTCEVQFANNPRSLARCRPPLGTRGEFLFRPRCEWEYFAGWGRCLKGDPLQCPLDESWRARGRRRDRWLHAAPPNMFQPTWSVGDTPAPTAERRSSRADRWKVFQAPQRRCWRRSGFSSPRAGQGQAERP